MDIDYLAAARLMTRIGGSFAGAIGEAYLVADSSNRARLVAAFDDLLDRYQQMAVELDRLQAQA